MQQQTTLRLEIHNGEAATGFRCSAGDEVTDGQRFPPIDASGGSVAFTLPIPKIVPIVDGSGEVPLKWVLQRHWTSRRGRVGAVMEIGAKRGRVRGQGAVSIALPGTILGIGLGGFVDGILLHQILQWHHMLTSTDTDNVGIEYYPADIVHGLQMNTCGTACSIPSPGWPC